MAAPKTNKNVMQKYIDKLFLMVYHDLNSPGFILMCLKSCLACTIFSLGPASSITIFTQRAMQVQNLSRFYVTNLLAVEMFCKGWAVCYRGDLVSNLTLSCIGYIHASFSCSSNWREEYLEGGMMGFFLFLNLQCSFLQLLNEQW